jgi:hypothetical protein
MTKYSSTGFVLAVLLSMTASTLADPGCRVAKNGSRRSRPGAAESATDNQNSSNSNAGPRIGSGAAANDDADAGTTVDFNKPSAGDAAPAEKAAGPAKAGVVRGTDNLRLVREQSLRNTATLLRIDYDSMLGDDGDDGGGNGGGNGGGGGASGGGTDDAGAARPPAVKRGERLRNLAKFVVGAASKPEIQGLLLAVAPEAKAAMALKIALEAGNLLAKTGQESSSEESTADLHAEASTHDEEFAAFLEEEIAERHAEEQVELLKKRQEAELELLAKEQAVERLERSLKRAKSAAEKAENDVDTAKKAANGEVPAPATP